jgi:dihydropteroate synthase
MDSININLFNCVDIGDLHPIVIMGVINLSPESFYQGSVLTNIDELANTINKMLNNGAKMLDIGARSTAPWSDKITVEEELNRIIPVVEKTCKLIPKEIIVSIDTQYEIVAKECYKITQERKRNMIVNDVSNLKTDPGLSDFVVKNDMPIILMASNKAPGDILLITDIISSLKLSINSLEKSGLDKNKIIIDPGIGAWIPDKTFEYDLGIINNLEQLRVLKKPILVAISRKSFIGNALDIPNPENRYYGSLSSSAIAVYNGAHVVRTHDVSRDFNDFAQMAKILRENRKKSQ